MPELESDPGAVFAPAVAFDATRNRLIVTGGEGADRSLPQTTWEWNGTAWSIASSGGPSGRFWAAMAHDPVRRRTVLFGGANGSGALDDTWEFDGTSWVRRTAPGPGPRFAHEMAWDASRGRVVMHGGTGPGGPFGDAWEWDGSTWSRIDAPGPSPRFTHAMAFDAARQRLVVFGGHGRLSPDATAMTQLGDTWGLAGSWASVPGAGPEPRDHVSMAYDAFRQRIVLHGGVRNPGPGQLADTWEFDGTSWTLRASGGPLVHGNHRLVYDQERHRVLLFTGTADGARTSTVHAWDGTSWQRLTP